MTNRSFGAHFRQNTSPTFLQLANIQNTVNYKYLLVLAKRVKNT